MTVYVLDSSALIEFAEANGFYAFDLVVKIIRNDDELKLFIPDIIKKDVPKKFRPAIAKLLKEHKDLIIPTFTEKKVIDNLKLRNRSGSRFYFQKDEEFDYYFIATAWSLAKSFKEDIVVLVTADEGMYDFVHDQKIATNLGTTWAASFVKTMSKMAFTADQEAALMMTAEKMFDKLNKYRKMSYRRKARETVLDRILFTSQADSEFSGQLKEEFENYIYGGSSEKFLKEAPVHLLNFAVKFQAIMEKISERDFMAVEQELDVIYKNLTVVSDQEFLRTFRLVKDHAALVYLILSQHYLQMGNLSGFIANAEKAKILAMIPPMRNDILDHVYNNLSWVYLVEGNIPAATGNFYNVNDEYYERYVNALLKILRDPENAELIPEIKNDLEFAMDLAKRRGNNYFVEVVSIYLKRLKKSKK